MPVRKPLPASADNAAAGEGIVLARFGAAHGVRGEVRLKSYTEIPLAIADYSPLRGSNGRAYRLTAARPAAGAAQDMLVVRVEGVADRSAAEALNGVELSVPRDRLPEPDTDDFYHADLIGLAAETADGDLLGTVTAVENHGAGDLLEVAPTEGAPFLVPFTRAVVPSVDIPAGKIVVDPPPGLLGGEEEDELER